MPAEATREAIKADFWSFYLSEHQDPRNQWLHAIGSLLALAWIVVAIATGTWWFLVAGAASGYGFAWAGHFFLEGNRPASFRFPVRSFLADWRLMALVLTRRKASLRSPAAANA